MSRKQNVFFCLFDIFSNEVLTFSFLFVQFSYPIFPKKIQCLTNLGTVYCIFYKYSQYIHALSKRCKWIRLHVITLQPVHNQHLALKTCQPSQKKASSRLKDMNHESLTVRCDTGLKVWDSR